MGVGRGRRHWPEYKDVQGGMGLHKALSEVWMFNLLVLCLHSRRGGRGREVRSEDDDRRRPPTER